MSKETHKYLIPSRDEVIKNKDIGKTTTPMTRLQKIGFAAMLKSAYEQLLKNPSQILFSIKTSALLKDMGITHRNVFSLYNNDEKRDELLAIKRSRGDFNNIILLNDIPSTEKRLQDHLVDLQHKSIQFKYKNEKGKLSFASNVILPYFSLDDNMVTFEFTSFIKDRILCERNAYIASMTILSSLSSSYAITLYELLLQRHRSDILGKQEWVCDIDELKEYLGGDELKARPIRTNNFKAAIIDKCVKEIDEKTTFALEVQSVKERKTVVAYKFIWEKVQRKKNKSPTGNNVVVECEPTEEMNKTTSSFFNEEQMDNKSIFDKSGTMQAYIDDVRVSTTDIIIRDGDTEDRFTIKDKKLLVKNKRVLKKDDSMQVWTWMFNNQDKVFLGNNEDPVISDEETLFDFYKKM